MAITVLHFTKEDFGTMAASMQTPMAYIWGAHTAILLLTIIIIIITLITIPLVLCGALGEAGITPLGESL